MDMNAGRSRDGITSSASATQRPHALGVAGFASGRIPSGHSSAGQSVPQSTSTTSAGSDQPNQPAPLWSVRRRLGAPVGQFRQHQSIPEQFSGQDFRSSHVAASAATTATTATAATIVPISFLSIQIWFILTQIIYNNSIQQHPERIVEVVDFFLLPPFFFFLFLPKIKERKI